MSRPALTGVILAGGRAQRMGGHDKGLILWQGAPLIAHVIERLRPQVETLLIVANRNLDDYRRHGHVVSDHHAGFPGPLAGLYAGLSAMTTEWALVVPVDAPRLAPDLAARLLLSLDATDPRPVLCRQDGHLQPLFGLYPASATASLDAHLQQEKRRLLAWCDDARACWVDWPADSGYFLNLNSPDDLEACP